MQDRQRKGRGNMEARHQGEKNTLRQKTHSVLPLASRAKGVGQAMMRGRETSIGGRGNQGNGLGDMMGESRNGGTMAGRCTAAAGTSSLFALPATRGCSLLSRKRTIAVFLGINAIQCKKLRAFRRVCTRFAPAFPPRPVCPPRGVFSE